MENLLNTPIKIGALDIPNRIVKAATVENMATEEGHVTDQLIKFYQKHAKGGAGLLITGGAAVQKNGRSVKYVMSIYDDSFIPGFEKMVNAVHEIPGKLILQLYHGGRQVPPELVAYDVVAPSAVKDTITKTVPRAMTEKEIEQTIIAFGEAAKRAQNAGFDGIEVMAGHGYLINQFLSNRTNVRSDQWGGSIENRSKFLFNIIDDIRGKVGQDYPLLVKINTEDKLKKGFTVEECAWVSERLSEHGVNAVKLTGGTHESSLNICRGDIPAEEILKDYSGFQKFRLRLIMRALSKKFKFSEAYFLENVKKIKPRVNIPVILVGGLRTPSLMEQILKDGDADLLALGRPLIRNPQIPRRVLDGNKEKFSCRNCNKCFVNIVKDVPLRCYEK